ncbi:DUF4238 domain-containing protein [Rhizobium ruizarguesonis]
MAIETGPKRHHFVPKVLQKHFVNGDGGLWAFDHRRPVKGIWNAKPDALLLQGHLYRHIRVDGTKDTELEQRFSRLESLAAPVVELV